MKTKIVPSSWLRRNGRRIDVGPYLSGSLEAKVRLEELAVRKDRLDEVTLGLVNAGRIKRTWVEAQEHGTPFLSSTDILKADLSNLRLIANKAVSENPKLVIHQGWTLITRAGSIGRMAYARRDMDGMACTEDVLRVVPDAEKIPSGYLYAFLSSKFGVPLVVSGTYGAIIQHIEPHHIADLPVPRLGEAVERRAHELVEQAAELRATSGARRTRVLTLVQKQLGWSHRELHTLTKTAAASTIQRRLDAFHHTAAVAEARTALARGSSTRRLGDAVEEVFEPNRGARRKVDNPLFGIPFLSSSEVFRLDPTGDYLISKKRTPNIEKSLVEERDVLVPRSGQLGGIIGRAVLPLPCYYGHAASEHLVRIRCATRDDAHLVWAVIATEPGYYASIGTAFGSSIPSLDCKLLADLAFPWWEGELRDTIIRTVYRITEGLVQAIEAERGALDLVENTIEEAS